MKASMKFREDKKPLFRAKIPLSIIGLPFQSGIVAGESKELTLNLSTFFESGPSLKIAYRPNDSYNPFSLIVKTGTGSFGSPISTSMLMSAEFNLLGQRNPTFMINFKPQFGDFSVKKSHSSRLDGNNLNGSVSEEDSSIEIVESSATVTQGDIAGLLSGVEVAARTSLPVRGRAVVNFRWGVRVPTEFDRTAVVSLRRFPFLVMDKIGIEHVDGGKEVNNKPTGDSGVDVGKVCLFMEELRSENRELKRAVEDLRGVMMTSSNVSVDYGSHSSKQREGERSSNGRARGDVRRSSERTASDCGGKKSKGEGDVAEELKKALKGAA
ncbi:unnamed protein product [Eruca vesicaria subsp. sativa]|uniref:Uncharacterized protein n=1 Tax=Eruca vesicaria subsp. sativa TaxID=29727 RepID=A0ABC8L213_ERUVS|nr:unnamed protein product [Eruca vesicaria subsp. sativa]